MANEAQYLDTQKIPENVLIGMLQSSIDELEYAKAKLQEAFDELTKSYNEMMALTSEERRKVREEAYRDKVVSDIRKENDTLIKKNKRLQKTNDDLTYKLAQIQAKAKEQENAIHQAALSIVELSEKAVEDESRRLQPELKRYYQMGATMMAMSISPIKL